MKKLLYILLLLPALLQAQNKRYTPVWWGSAFGHDSLMLNNSPALNTDSVLTWDRMSRLAKMVSPSRLGTIMGINPGGETMTSVARRGAVITFGNNNVQYAQVSGGNINGVNTQWYNDALGYSVAMNAFNLSMTGPSGSNINLSQADGLKMQWLNSNYVSGGFDFVVRQKAGSYANYIRIVDSATFISLLQAALNVNSGGETLASVTARGSTTSTGLTLSGTNVFAGSNTFGSTVNFNTGTNVQLRAGAYFYNGSFSSWLFKNNSANNNNSLPDIDGKLAVVSQIRDTIAAVEADLVHKSTNETITGRKVFTDDIYINKSAPSIYFAATGFPGTYSSLVGTSFPGVFTWYMPTASGELALRDLNKVSASDANYSASTSASFISLPDITANRTLTLPTPVSGRRLVVWNRNSNAFSWLTSNVIDAADNAVSAFGNDKVYNMIGDADLGKWVIVSYQ